jgi:hypothetical protein
MSMNCQSQPEGVTMHDRLSKFLTEDPEEHLWRHITRRLEDPLKPRANNGGLRVNPLVLILSSVALLGISIFVFFSYGLT